MSYLGILALLSLLIIVHELGHLIAARLAAGKDSRDFRDSSDTKDKKNSVSLRFLLSL